ncbi:MAG: hypothetical protein PUC32_07130 [Oscillospiraceae bacterium]|nr:hypothetical protein [Oscillospiraceae bacterium]
MQKKPLAILAVSLLAASLALSGCGDTQPAASSTAPSESVSSASNVSSTSEAASAGAEADESSSDVPAKTDEKFEAKFAENPIDASYDQQSGEVSTNAEMISLEETYAGLWKSEISHAYQQLLEQHSDTQAIEEDQKAWNDNLSDQVQQIKDSVTGDGSAVTLERAVKLKNFYREKAKSLYSQLYAYDQEYTYIYTPY